MIRITFLIFAIMVSHAPLVLSQDEGSSEVVLDVLHAPSSPAGTLLGISNSQIERPTDPTSFMLMINQATGNFSHLPLNFAIDMAPLWIFKGPKITIDRFLSDSIKHTLPQTLIVSLATKTVDSLENEAGATTKFSAGFKFSLLRGSVSSGNLNRLQKLRMLRMKLTRSFDDSVQLVLTGNNAYLKLKTDLFKKIIALQDSGFSEEQISNDSIITTLRANLAQIESGVQTNIRANLAEQFEIVKAAAEQVKLTRYGYKIDLAGGIVFDFPSKDFDSGSLTQAGVWLTGGYEWQNGLSVLGLTRFLLYVDKIYATKVDDVKATDINTTDVGLRLIYSNSESRFAFSGESVYRFVSERNIDPSVRFSINAEYDFGKNKKLTFIFGRDFDGTVTRKGNVIAALNVVFGLGSKKSL